MGLTYEMFEEKAEIFCVDQGIDMKHFTSMNDRNKLHVEMLKYVRTFYPSDGKSVLEAKKLCKEYENRFWSNHIV